jgi:hypothetical protein
MAKIEALIAEIKSGGVPSVRRERAEKLAFMVKQNADRRFEDATIDELIELLGDRQDGVRFWVAAALGNLGSQAVRAVPALERALKDVEGSLGSLTTEHAIVGALQRIRAAKKRAEEVSAKPKRPQRETLSP